VIGRVLCHFNYKQVNTTMKVFVMKGKERKGKERKGKERKGKERKGKERKGKERKPHDLKAPHDLDYHWITTRLPLGCHWVVIRL